MILYLHVLTESYFFTLYSVSSDYCNKASMCSSYVSSFCLNNPYLACQNISAVLIQCLCRLVSVYRLSCRLEGRGIVLQPLVRSRELCVLQNINPGCGSHPPTFLFAWLPGFFPLLKAAGSCWSHTDLVPRLRKSGAIPPLPCMPLWAELGQ